MGTAAASSNLQHGYPAPGPQKPSAQNVMDHVFFLSQTEWKQAREEGSFDLVIIGSGFCGLAVAERALANNPHCRILMVERGPFFLPEHFQNLPLPFVNTLGGMSETFPWTLSAATAEGKLGTIRWQHGMVPFFGGRSTLWSAWCPRPNATEMAGWPEPSIRAAERNFAAAEALLRVQKADQIDQGKSPAALELLSGSRPVYGALQRRIQELLAAGAIGLEGIYRSEAAPLASDAKAVDGVDFQKYSTPGEILALAMRQADLAAAGEGAALSVVSDCVVEKILQQEGRATALQTSRGVLALGQAQLVLAMGTLPPTTLLRNSFPQIPRLGERFSAHFISSIVARVPKKDLLRTCTELELAACYVAGIGQDYQQQFHIQLSALWDEQPEKNAGIALRYMPDVVATASMAQLRSSQDHVVFVCAVLGELDYRNRDSWFLTNPQDADPTTNSLLQVAENESDRETWAAMDQATFAVLEQVLSPQGAASVEYWHGSPDHGAWTQQRPSVAERRVDALVHESSTLHLGVDDSAPVDLNYRLRGSENVYITGGALWPQGGSWNPTLTMVALAQDLADQLVPASPDQ